MDEFLKVNVKTGVRKTSAICGVFERLMSACFSKAYEQPAQVSYICIE